MHWTQIYLVTLLSIAVLAMMVFCYMAFIALKRQKVVMREQQTAIEEQKKYFADTAGSINLSIESFKAQPLKTSSVTSETPHIVEVIHHAAPPTEWDPSIGPELERWDAHLPPEQKKPQWLQKYYEEAKESDEREYQLAADRQAEMERREAPYTIIRSTTAEHRKSRKTKEL